MKKPSGQQFFADKGKSRRLPEFPLSPHSSVVIGQRMQSLQRVLGLICSTLISRLVQILFGAWNFQFSLGQLSWLQFRETVQTETHEAPRHVHSPAQGAARLESQGPATWELHLRDDTLEKSNNYAWIGLLLNSWLGLVTSRKLSSP